jgi:hypothetical protein
MFKIYFVKSINGDLLGSYNSNYFVKANKIYEIVKNYILISWEKYLLILAEI